MTNESFVIIIFSKGVKKRKFITQNTKVFEDKLIASCEWLKKNNGSSLYCYDFYYGIKFSAHSKNEKIIMSEGWFNIGSKYSYQSTFSLSELKKVALG